MGIMRDTDKIVQVYMDLLLMWSDRNPSWYISTVDAMEGGIDGREFLTKEQKDELKAKYEELKA